MNSNSNELWRFEDRYKKMKRFYDIRQVELENVIMDHELIRDGWKIHFVVDFHQVFSFAFPLSEEGVSLLEDEEKRAHMAMIQAARAFTFYGLRYCPHPVLIPPYATELRNWLSVAISKSKESILQMRTIQHWGQSLITEEEKELIDKAIEWYEIHDGEEIMRPKFLIQLLDLVNSKFLDMYFLISGAMAEGIKIIRNLYRGEEPHLETAYKRWNNYEEMTKDVKGSYRSDWYLLFSKIRKNKTIPNIRDAAAIDIIMALNSHLMKDKEIVLLISDADTMNQLLNEIIKGKRRGSVVCPQTKREIPILRTSNTFLTYMTSVEEGLDIETDLERLRHEKDELADFYAIEETIKEASRVCIEASKAVRGNCLMCSNLGSCEDVAKKLTQHHEKTNEINSLRLILNRFRFLEPYLDFSKSDEKLEDNIKEVIQFLAGKSENFEERLKKKVKELEKELDDLINDIEDPSIDLAPRDALEFLGYRLKRLNGIPYKIVFKNPKIKDTITNLFKSMNEEKITEIRENAKEIFDLTHDPKTGDEGKLLLVSLLYCYKHYEMVKDITSRMLSKTDLEGRGEFVLLRCLSLVRMGIGDHSKFYYNKAYEECSEAIKRNASDSRFRNLLGVTIGRGVRAGLETEKTIDDAIEVFQKALEHCTTEDKMLKATINNNIAYSITLKLDHTLAELNHASDLIKEMEELWPRKNWVSDFWHTDGCVQFSLAELTENLSERKTYLRKSSEKLKKALEIGEKHQIHQTNIDRIRKKLDASIQKLKSLENCDY